MGCFVRFVRVVFRLLKDWDFVARPLLEDFRVVDFLAGDFFRETVFALLVVLRVDFDVFFAIQISTLY